MRYIFPPTDEGLAEMRRVLWKGVPPPVDVVRDKEIEDLGSEILDGYVIRLGPVTVWTSEE